MKLNDPVQKVPGIGPKSAAILNKYDINTVEDLLWYIPFRYEDRTNIQKIAHLQANTQYTVIGEVVSIDNIFTRNRKRLSKAQIKDDTGILDLLWFNQHYIKNSIPKGSIIAVTGELNPKETKPQFLSPDWERADTGNLTHTLGFIPIYSAIEGLNSKWFRAKLKLILDQIIIEEIIPETIKQKEKFLDRDEAFHNIHFPENLEDAATAKTQLSFEELLFLHLKGLKLQKEWYQKKNSHIIKLSSKQKDRFIKTLPYKLTGGQTRTIDEILKDLSAEFPMNRLLQGDVGSGKTVVAATAILACLESGFNCIYMAPTVMLAKQHSQTLTQILKPLFQKNISIVTLTGDEKHFDLPKNNNYLAVTTHSVLYNLDLFENIGLVVVDEQHKFGVEQRTIVIDHYTKELTPNLLTMTATPIPRTLALTFYGDLSLSVIDEMPSQRLPVKTLVIKEKKRLDAYKWIDKQITEHQTQVFVVCPFIEQSETKEFELVKAAEVEYEKISKQFNNRKVGLLHGRIKSKEKNEVVDQFKNKIIDILVTTPVIEVGIDIPNANIILIETPERFGLASLHQLRGRVGRGKAQGYCVLVASENSEGYQRLKYLETIYNGNKLAEIDLKIRGPGNIYGTEQHGYLKLKAADISDIDLVVKTKQYALHLFENIDKYPIISRKLLEYKNIERN